MIQPQEPTLPSLFHLGDWEVRRDEGTLCAGDRTVRLEPRVMDVLVHLAANPDRVVSKEELLEEVWGGAFVEEGALAQAIHSLRKALGDDARQPRFIQTVPKRGYRLLVPVGPEIREMAPDEPHRSVSPGHDPDSRSSSRPSLLAPAAILVMVVVLSIVWAQQQNARQDPANPDKGIRMIVLPFESFGEPADPDFAAGLTQEITANLTLLPMMQVIPGRNALGAKGVIKPLVDIEKELKVDYVLMGTVDWRMGSRQVRVRPQLIRMTDKVIVFGNPLVVNGSDLFRAQQEISRHLIGTLGVTLTPQQSLAVGARTAENPEAYRSYVQGLVLKDQPFYSPEHLERAALMFQQAVGMDPGFVEAWAKLSEVHSYLAFNTDPSPARVEKARVALQRAIGIDPDLPAVRLAQIYFSYRCLGDFDAALRQVEAALRHSPHDAELTKMNGLALMRKGRLPEAVQMLRRASALDPRSLDLVWIIADIHRAMREYEMAEQEFARAISLAPDVPAFWEKRALNRLCWTGRPEEARAVLDQAPMPPLTPPLQMVAFQLDLDEHDYRTALTRLSSPPIQMLPLQDQSRLFVLGVIARERMGDHKGALAAAEVNRSVLEKRVALYPKEAIHRAYLALTLAQLNQREQALAQAEKALNASRKDLFSGPQVLEVRAMVDVTLGRRAEAVAHLRRLLSVSYRSAICVAELRVSPVWEPLQEDQGFRDILNAAEGSILTRNPKEGIQ